MEDLPVRITSGTKSLPISLKSGFLHILNCFPGTWKFAEKNDRRFKVPVTCEVAPTSQAVWKQVCTEGY